MPLEWKDMIVACIITGVISLLFGMRLGYNMCRASIDYMAQELYKQFDVDGKPFVNEKDPEDDAEDWDWLNNPDDWKNR